MRINTFKVRVHIAIDAKMPQANENQASGRERPALIAHQ